MLQTQPEPFINDAPGEVPVRGLLQRAAAPNGDALVITHGAGGNCNAALLFMLANAFADSGVAVLRCDLPFRQARPHGAPSPASAQRDQAGLRRAVMLMKAQFAGRMFLGGQSYGGRQASMLVASEPQLVDGLLLLSYPLHPPGRPAQLRTAHLPNLRTPALFVSGTKDPFGSIEELQAAITLVPAPARLLPITGAGHSLLLKKGPALPPVILQAFNELFR